MARRLARAFSVLILTTTAACDNVNWGGADFTIVPPPPRSAAPAAETPAEPEPSEETLPQGPIVYYVARAPQGGIMVPVGEVRGDSLAPLRARSEPRVFADRFIAEHMRQGSEFVLFRGGVRVGTLIVQSATAPAGDACTALPRATGTLELSAAAASASEFLALSQLYAPQIPRRPAQPLTPTGTMTFVAPILAERMIRRRGASLPGNWARARAQVHPFPVTTGSEPAFASTFLVGDTLGPGLDNEGYSLFFLAVPSAAEVGWDTVHVRFIDYATEGKAAPRVIDYLDWNRDDQVELLLQVYGTDSSWFEAVGRGGRDEWRRVLDDRCAAGAAGPDSVGAPSGSRIPVPRARPDTV